MAKILEMPKLSPTMEEGVLSVWHKKEGDAVQVDDLLAEVETDKATMEFRSFDRGHLLKILVKAGTPVKLGQAVAIFGNPGEDTTALEASIPTAGPSATPAAAPAAAPAAPPPAAEPSATPPAKAPSSAAANSHGVPAPAPRSTGNPLDRTEREGDDLVAPTGGRVLASPYVRKTARDLGVDLNHVSGSGPRGRILAEDVQRAPRGQGPSTGTATPSAASRPSESRPLSMMRKTIARRLTESKQTVPHFYLSIDVNAGELVALRERLNGDLAAASRGSKGKTEGETAPKVSINDLLIRACALALRKVPECNAQFTPDALIIHRRVDISVAVAIPDGLVTPVLRNADQKSVVEISREVRELAERARAKKLTPEEMTQGTFSISNLGMFGIDEFAAVINPPEGAILAVGRVRDEPVLENGAVVPGKRLAMTLSCDHRVIDGAVGAAFLAELRALLEHPFSIVAG